MKTLVIATDSGFISYDDKGKIHFGRSYSCAERYFSDLQAEIAAKNIGVHPFWILEEKPNAKEKK